MSADQQPPANFEAFAEQMKRQLQQLKEGGEFDFGRLEDLPDEEKAILAKLVLGGVGIGVALYFGKKTLDGIATTDLSALGDLAKLPAEVFSRVRNGAQSAGKTIRRDASQWYHTHIPRFPGN